MRSHGKADEFKAIHVSQEQPGKHLDYFAESPHTTTELPEGTNQLPLAIWKKLMAGVRHPKLSFHPKTRQTSTT